MRRTTDINGDQPTDRHTDKPPLSPAHLDVGQERARFPFASPHGGLRDLKGQLVGEVVGREEDGLVPRIAQRQGHVGEGLMFGV